MPNFKNETEEADWWFANREQVSRELVTAARTARTSGGVARRARLAQRARARAQRIEFLATIRSLTAELNANQPVFTVGVAKPDAHWLSYWVPDHGSLDSSVLRHLKLRMPEQAYP